MEDGRKNNGGKRREGLTRTPRRINIDNDLIPLLSQIEGKSINTFVSEAIREKFEKERNK